MLSFNRLKEQRKLIAEGGNTVVLNAQGKRTAISAEKIAFSDLLSASEFVSITKNALKALNVLFGKWIQYAKTNANYSKINALIEQYHIHAIWPREDILTSGYAFNGSSEFLMSSLSEKDAQILATKQYFGDIDVTVPHICFVPLFIFLYDLQFNPSFISPQLKSSKIKVPSKESSVGTLIWQDDEHEIYYSGNNKNKVKNEGGVSISSYQKILENPLEFASLQINSVFILKKNDLVLHFQVDFEKTEYQKNVKNYRGSEDRYEYGPSEQSKFGHSSSLEDIAHGLKGAFHKFALMALAKIMTEIENAVKITTRGFSAEGGEKFFKLGISTGSFSVDKGFRKKFKMASQPKAIEDIERKLEEKLKLQALTQIYKITGKSLEDKLPRKSSTEYKAIVDVLNGSVEGLNDENKTKIAEIATQYNTDLKELRDKLSQVKTQLQEVPSQNLTTEDYISTIEDLYKTLFKKKTVDDSTKKDMLSFLGLLRLVKKNLKPNRIHKFFLYILKKNTWEKTAQRLERNNPKADYEIKKKMMETLLSQLGQFDDSVNLKEDYNNFIHQVDLADYEHSGRKEYHFHSDLEKTFEVKTFTATYSKETLSQILTQIRKSKNLSEIEKQLKKEYTRTQKKELLFFINQLHYYNSLKEQKDFLLTECIDKIRLLCYYLVYVFVSPEDEEDREEETL